MTRRTIGIDLAIRGDHVAQIFDDGHPVGKPICFRNDPASLEAFVGLAIEGAVLPRKPAILGRFGFGRVPVISDVTCPPE